MTRFNLTTFVALLSLALLASACVRAPVQIVPLNVNDTRGIEPGSKIQGTSCSQHLFYFLPIGSNRLDDALSPIVEKGGKRLAAVTVETEFRWWLLGYSTCTIVNGYVAREVVQPKKQRRPRKDPHITWNSKEPDDHTRQQVQETLHSVAPLVKKCRRYGRIKGPQGDWVRASLSIENQGNKIQTTILGAYKDTQMGGCIKGYLDQLTIFDIDDPSLSLEYRLSASK